MEEESEQKKRKRESEEKEKESGGERPMMMRRRSWKSGISTSSMRTSAALGTEAAAILAAVEVSLGRGSYSYSSTTVCRGSEKGFLMVTDTTVAHSPRPRGMLFIWAMKTEAEVMNSAVPSMFTVAPMGSTNLEREERREERRWRPTWTPWSRPPPPSCSAG